MLDSDVLLSAGHDEASTSLLACVAAVAANNAS
jgi:hypothetical protein